MPDGTTLGGPSLHRLTATSRALSDETPLDEVLAITLDTAASLLGARSVVLLLQDERDRTTVRACRGVPPEALERFDASLDEALFARLGSLLDTPGDRPPAPGHFMGVPLLVQGRVVGLLVVLLAKERPDERDEWILSALADQASAALEHALREAARSGLAAEVEELRIRGQRQEHALQIVQHDLRTPLGAIRGYLDLLERGAYGPLSARQGAALERIDVAVEHLETLVDEALEMSRVLAGEVSVTLEPLQVAPVIEEAMGMLALEARSARVRLHRQVPDELRVVADGGRLRQVLVHLLDNAIKHGGPDSEVLIECTAEAESETATLRVRDGGAGVAPELAEEIFEPYKSFGTRGGSGLGLAIARGVTELMGGELGMERPGSGATFFVRLPRA